VLLLHRHLPHADVVTGLEAALHVGASAADVVAVEARKRTQQTPRRTQPTMQLAWPPPGEPIAQVVSLTVRRLAERQWLVLLAARDRERGRHAADTLTGRAGLTAHAIDPDRLLASLDRHGARTG